MEHLQVQGFFLTALSQAQEISSRILFSCSESGCSWNINKGGMCIEKGQVTG
jgi:hypothetical protein